MDVSALIAELYGAAMREQARLFFRQTNSGLTYRPVYGPPEPPLLVRDLIKRLQEFDPNDRVMYQDYEHGLIDVMDVKKYEYLEGYVELL